MKKFILSRLLYAANQAPTAKDIFYPIKQKLLKQYGTRVATDLQVITGKRCTSCEDGIYTAYVYGWPPSRKCYHCDGTGWYAPNVIVQLDLYRIGGKEMHLIGRVNKFRKAIERLPDQIVFGKIIEGHIYKHGWDQKIARTALFAETCLAILYNRPAYSHYKPLIKTSLFYMCKDVIAKCCILISIKLPFIAKKKPIKTQL